MGRRIVLILLIFFLTCCYIGSHVHIQRKASPRYPTHGTHLDDPALFAQAKERSGEYTYPTKMQIVGGIVPHHLLAAPLIDGFFEGIRAQKIKNVILLSPNHYGVGGDDIVTSKAMWKTVFGEIQPALSEIEALIAHNTVVISEEVFETEHGIYGLLPFVKEFFPQSQLIPIVLKGGTHQKKLDTLAQTLATVANRETLLLVSSDFSHYLPLEEANTYDLKTLEVIQRFSLQQLLTLDHTKQTDSPESIYVLLKTLQQKHVTGQTLIAHSNSALLLKDRSIPQTTSYVTMYFYQ